MDTLISVIVPIYKVEQYLDECVQSIINQTYKNLEIILVDDGSPDNCGKMCDEYAVKDSRIKVIHKPNGGLSDARNAALDIAKGEYISFIDSDDWIEPQMMEKMLEAVSVNNSQIAVCGIYDVYGKKKLKGRCPAQCENIVSEKMLMKIFERKECDVSVCDKLYHRSIFKDLRFPIGQIYEDAAIIYKAVSKAQNISFVNVCLYNYRHRENSIITSKFSEEKLINIEHANNLRNFVNKNYPNIKIEAEQYYNGKIIEVLTIINTSESDIRKQYADFYKEKIKELSKRKRYLSNKDKLKYYMLKTKIYRFLKKINMLLKQN